MNRLKEDKDKKQITSMTLSKDILDYFDKIREHYKEELEIELSNSAIVNSIVKMYYKNNIEKNGKD